MSTSWPSTGSRWATTGADSILPTPQLWDHLAYHLAAAGPHHEVATVADPAWLVARIRHDGSLAAEHDLTEASAGNPRTHS